MKKNVVIEILDEAWDYVDEISNSLNYGPMKDKEKIEKMTSWRDLVDAVCTKKGEDFFKGFAADCLRFEIKYFFRKPVRTMKWLYGSHVELYDVWGCEKHRYSCITKDEDGYPYENMTVLCPECNEKNMTDDKYNSYMALMHGHFLPEGIWNILIKRSRWMKAEIRKENIRYWIKKWTTWSYLRYRLLKLFGRRT